MATTIFKISADPVDYGEDCANSRKCAQAIKAGVQRYVKDCEIDVEVMIVPETQSLSNRSVGDSDTILELEDLVARNWIDWVPSGAANCAEA